MEEQARLLAQKQATRPKPSTTEETSLSLGKSEKYGGDRPMMRLPTRRRNATKAKEEQATSNDNKQSGGGGDDVTFFFDMDPEEMVDKKVAARKRQAAEAPNDELLAEMENSIVDL